jgi:ribosomal protein L7/L12
MEKYNPLITSIVSYKLFHPGFLHGTRDSSLVDLSESDLKEIRDAINIQIGKEAETDMYEPTAPHTGRATFVSASLLEHEWMIYVLQGSMIDAIRCHRREFGSGLREAKDIVEAFRGSLYTIQSDLAAQCKAQRAKEGLAY